MMDVMTAPPEHPDNTDDTEVIDLNDPIAGNQHTIEETDAADKHNSDHNPKPGDTHAEETPPEPEKQDKSPTKPSTKPSPMSDIERIKAAQAARRNRRARPSPRPPPSKSAAPPPAADASNEDPELKKLRQDSATLRIEMASLRRNHLENIKKLAEERDMFANQLAREQTLSRTPSQASKMEEDLAVQLRAARTRNTDLENENTMLRDEVKQLNFRVQASRTLDVASDGYDKIVDELVKVKLQCAQLQEEKEHLLRMNKELSTTTAVLSDANGTLEKSRSEWVMQCADLEREKHKLHIALKTATEGIDRSDSGSLQDIKLN